MSHKISVVFSTALCFVGIGLACPQAAISATQPASRSTRLIAAAKRGDLPAVRALIAQGANVDARDIFGWTPLMYAADQKHPSVVRYLIAKHADVNTRDNGGSSPLIQAVNFPADDIVKMLLNAGANPNTRDSQGMPPLCSLIGGDKTDHTLILELLKHGANPNLKVLAFDITPLVSAVDSQEPWDLQQLLTHGGNPNWANEKGETLLMRAVEAWQGRLLLEYGADANARDPNGNTALMRHGDPDYIRFLLQHGAAVNARNKEGRTALMVYATEVMVPQPIEILLKNGADPTLKDNHGNTALSLILANSPTFDVEKAGKKTLIAALQAAVKKWNGGHALVIAEQGHTK